MSRAFKVFALIVAAALPLNACAREPVPAASNTAEAAPAAAAQPAPSVPVTASAPVVDQETRVAAATVTATAIGQWQAGTNYIALPTPQPTNVGAGKIEVLEIFWYGCPHCYALEPAMESYKANKPAFVEFTRMPVMWGPMHKQQARLFYALQALERPDLHTKAFETIQRQNPLAAASDAEARAKQLAWAKAQGVSEKDFNSAYDSMTVTLNMQRAEEATRRYQVASVPLLVVNGRYVTDVGRAGDASKLVALLNDLAASEKRR